MKKPLCYLIDNTMYCTALVGIYGVNEKGKLCINENFFSMHELTCVRTLTDNNILTFK